MNQVYLALVGAGLFLTVIGAVSSAVRTITKDNATMGAALKDTITAEVGSLKVSIAAIQERHIAAVDKVETVVMPRLDDLEGRMRKVEFGELLEDVVAALGRKSKGVSA